jgi:hypothetical protein
LCPLDMPAAFCLFVVLFCSSLPYFFGNTGCSI